ncbi:MAG: LysR family transcriptional regulator [Myxococcota bacterium]
MGLSELETFIRVAETGSLTAAGRLLGVPTSTVSRRITRLEEDLGQQLVLRTARSLRLTDAGAAVHERCAQPLRDIEEVERALRDHDAEPRGDLRITAPADLGSTEPFVRLLTEFRVAWPHVHLLVDLTDRVVDLVAERVDVAVRAHLTPLADRSSLMTRRVGSLVSSLFASRAYVDARGLPATPADLVHHACISTNRGRGARTWPLRPRGGGAEIDLAIDPVIVVNDMNFVRHAIEAGAGIGMLPDFYSGAALVRVLPDWVFPTGHLSLVWPAGRTLSPRVRKFIDFAPRLLTQEGCPGAPS